MFLQFIDFFIERSLMKQVMIYELLLSNEECQNCTTDKEFLEINEDCGYVMTDFINCFQKVLS